MVSETPRRYLRKSERLGSWKTIGELVRSGKSLHAPPFRLTWMETPRKEKTPWQVAFIVPKRSFAKATDRNRIRRLMREALRNNKTLLHPLDSGNRQYAFLITFTGRDIPDYTLTVEKSVQLLQRFAETIRKNNG